MPKITVTIKPVDELPPETADAMMQRTLALLASHGLARQRQMVLTFEHHDEDEALILRDQIRAALSGRPAAIDAKVRFQADEFVQVERQPTVTPMDSLPAFRDSDAGITLSGGGRSVTLTPETAANAERMLRDATA